MAKISKIFTFIKVGSVLGTPKTPEGGSKCWSSKYTIEIASQVFLCGGGKKGRSAPLVALPKSNSASKHSEVWVSFNPLQWQAPSYPDYSKKKKKKKKKLLVIRSGCVELSKRRKLRLIIISKINRLKSNSDIHCVFEIQDFLPGGWPQGSVLRKVKLHLKKRFLVLC